MESIIISNPSKFKEIKDQFIKDGIGKVQIIADFDRTLFKAFYKGKSVQSVFAVMYNDNYLTSDFGWKGRALEEKYKKIEIDPNISIDGKEPIMNVWWGEIFDLLIKSRLNKKDIKRIVDSPKIVFRDGFNYFLDKLKEKNIPLLIFSAGAIGKDSIGLLLEREKRFSKNIEIISNSYNWDEKGYAISVKKPIITSMNKGKISIIDYPEIYSKVKDRKNVILVGDSLEDVKMGEIFDYSNIIKIGFLNERIEESLESYKNMFDVVILNDGSMDFVNNLLKEIIK